MRCCCIAGGLADLPSVPRLLGQRFALVKRQLSKFIPRVSPLSAPGSGKRREPGNEVGESVYF